MRRGLAPILALALLAAAAPRLEAADQLWSALILASNSPKPAPTPPELQSFSDRLKRIVGYNQLEIVGSSTAPLEEKKEILLSPTPRFSIKVTARRASAKEARGGYLLNLRLFQDQRQLVDSFAKLAPGSPLFIRGPLHARGQLMLVLQVQDEKGKPVTKEVLAQSDRHVESDRKSIQSNAGDAQALPVAYQP